jgi:hypothetical protein
MSALKEFWEYARDFRTLLGWTVKSAFAAPLVPILLNLGPPWDAGSPGAAKGAVAILTAIAQMFGLTSAFAFGSAWTADGAKTVLRRSLWVGSVSFLLYLAAFVFLTEQPSPPREPQRYVTGFLKTKAYYIILPEAANSPEDAKDFLGRDPVRIWEPWTVYVSLFIVSVTWLVFFGSLAFYIGAFIRGIPILRDDSDSVQDRRSIYELGLPVGLRHDLEAAGIVTIGDLVSKTEGELLQMPRIGEAKVESIRLLLREQDRCLRGEALQKVENS